MPATVASRRVRIGRGCLLGTLAASLAGFCLHAQALLNGPGGPPNILPTDMAVLEAREPRQDLPCTVTPQKPLLGFDLRFHAGFDISVGLKDLAGPQNELTILFRVAPESKPDSPVYFIQRIHVPPIEEGAHGEANLQGSYDLGEGKYKVDWLMKDQAERVCSSYWDSDATLVSKDKGVVVTLDRGEVAPTDREQFEAAPFTRRAAPGGGLNLKILVNFAPQNALAATLQDSDTDAIVNVLRCMQRDPRIVRFSVVAFNLQEERVVYRQDATDQIDFPALGEAVHNLRLGRVELDRLAQKKSANEFLASLLADEIANAGAPDAFVVVGPKMLVEESIPTGKLPATTAVDFPVFYLNYNLAPVATPWRDAMSGAIRLFKGQEFTITRPRDLWFAFTELVGKVVKFKAEKRETAASVAVKHGS
jgi:hypothetical protein